MKKFLSIMLCIAIISVLFAGCSTGTPAAPAAKDADLDDILTAIQDAYGEYYLAGGEMPLEFIEMEFGITEDMYDDIRGEMALITVFNDRLLLVKAKEGKADDVQKALDDALERKINDGMQYPMNLPKSKGAIISRNGNYFAFIMLGQNGEFGDSTSDEALNFAKEQSQIGADVFDSFFK